MENFFKRPEARLIIEKSTDSNERPSYLHDRDRILFSRSFRRLAKKTQLVPALGIKSSDHLRSRLTHSLEVMQIAASIGNYINLQERKEEKVKIAASIGNYINLQERKEEKVKITASIGNYIYQQERKEEKVNIHLIEAISLGHDLGHTPYGHVGEEALCDFFKRSIDHGCFPEKKLKHSFQSLKKCCFLEKQYLPDNYGLNLTVSTLDGILKHSKIEEKEREFYKKCFESYYQVFIKDFVPYTKIDEKSYGTMKDLFEYCSPVTLEGSIVSIADEIAQLSHDIEDMRRLTSMDRDKMLIFYKKVKEVLSSDLGQKNMDMLKLTDTYNVFSDTLDESKNNSILRIKCERMYTKLILNFSISIVGRIMSSLWSIPEDKRLIYLKQYHTGSFEDLLTLSKEFSDIPEVTKIGLKCLCKIFKDHEEILQDEMDIVRWDLKGKEICDDLMNILNKTLDKKLSYKEQDKLIIFNKEQRNDLTRSYKAGFKFGEKLGSDKLDEIARKCLIWDYIAGMTDNFIIEEYESLSCKRVGL